MRTAGLLLALTACHGVSADPNDTRVVTSGLIRPGDVAVGGGTLYVVEQIEVGVQPMYDIKSIVTSGDDFPHDVDAGHVIIALAADGAGAYWIDDAAGSCNVRAWDGAHARTIGTTASGIYCALRNLAVGNDAVYFSDDLGQLWRVPKSGSGAVQLGTTDTTAGSVAFDGAGVWVTTLHGVKHFPLAGNSEDEVTLASDRGPDAIAADGITVYALAPSASNDVIVRVDPNNPTSLGSVTQPFQLVAIDGVLFGAGSGGADGIWTVSESGGDLEVLRDEATYAGIAVDADSIYWADPSGQILAMKR